MGIGAVDNDQDQDQRRSCWWRSRPARETAHRVAVVYLAVMAERWARGAELSAAARWAVPGGVGVLVSSLGLRIGDRDSTYPWTSGAADTAAQGEQRA